MIVDIAPRRSPIRSKISSASSNEAVPAWADDAIGSSGMMSSSASPPATRIASGSVSPASVALMNQSRMRPSAITPSSRSTRAVSGSSPTSRAIRSARV